MNETAIAKPEERFSDRVENYVRYRPGYPTGIMEMLRREFCLTSESVVSDIGSGTGISTELFLREGCVVHAVEPNAAMREAAERGLGNYPNFHSVSGSAQVTTLPDDSADFVVAFQAFHWFDKPETRAEFTRILKSNGHLVLVWNERLLDATPFLIDYEKLLTALGTDYHVVRHEKTNLEKLKCFFRGDFATRMFTNTQALDFESLKGRVLSVSYTPAEGHPNHEVMMKDLRGIFDRHQIDGEVALDYRTMVYIGR